MSRLKLVNLVTLSMSSR